jgi:cobyrinic acid a,c-diamide synthase
MEEMPATVKRRYLLRRSGVDLGTEGYVYKNCLASYVHIHFGSSPGMAESFVASCRKFKEKEANGTRKKRKKRITAD